MAEIHQDGEARPAPGRAGCRFFNTMRLAARLHFCLAEPPEWRQEDEEMKTKLLALALLAGSTVFAGPRVFVGVNIGAPPPPPAVAYVPPAPGPGYTWVAGYWYPSGARYAWHAGYWARPPYARGYWVAPRYYGHHYYGGYWRR